MACVDKQNHTIVLDIAESMYEKFISDSEVAHRQIKEAFKRHPELFPSGMKHYMLNGKTRVSQKLGVELRKIKVALMSFTLFLLVKHWNWRHRNSVSSPCR